ncbi:ATP-binding protein [Massilia sp. TS11]|uniref:sensor histidine kinase n=1 Tax=Massilia sp. TS11 TaxID=2908003 RepID=UPI001EDA33CC|nr:ATP-binding protein [Massilia sp. TS11]MCG2583959.1 ATP-binding protein [Massilia sp. TS11]
MPFRRFLHRRGLAAYLAAALAGLSVVLTLILVLVIGVAASQPVKENIGNGLAELAGQLSDKLDRGMFERYREVRLMAERAEMRPGHVRPAEQRRLLDQLRDTYPYYAWIGIATLDGKVLAATGGLLEGADISQRPWFGNAQKGVYLGDVHEAVKLAKLLPNASGEPLRFVDVAFPVQDDEGKVVAVLGAHLSWQWAREVEQSIMEPVAQRLQAESLVAGTDGSALLASPGMPANVASQASFAAAGKKTGYLVERWPDGRSYVVGYSRSQGFASYPGLGWVSLVRQDIDAAYAPLRALQWRVLLIGLAVALLFSALGVWLSRAISRPLTALADAASAMRRDQPAPLPAAADTYIEVHTLRAAIDRLVQDLGKEQGALAALNAGLESRVAERTVALEAALQAVRLNEARVQAILNAAQDAYLAVGLDGFIQDWGGAAPAMFGWSREEAVGKRVTDLLIPAAYRQRFDSGLLDAGEVARAEGRRLERVVQARDGHSFPVEVSFTLVAAGGQQFYSAFLHDISERKQVEQRKDEFIGTASHELRTPLTALRAAIDMLVDGMAGALPPDVDKLLRVAQGSCDRMVRLVNDMLDLEKMECGKMSYQFQPQALQPVLEQARAAMLPLAEEANVRLQLEVEGALAARLDADRMQQVLTNLLSNAIKFSPPGGTVYLSAGRHGPCLRVRVRDEGPGIPAEFQARVFERFAQAGKGPGGSGLGLSICKHIVEAHGGSIHFQSVDGKGASFIIDLPA